MKTGALVMGTLFVLSLAVACGNEDRPGGVGDHPAAPDRSALKAWSVVDLYPDFGDGVPAETNAARILPDDSVQVVVAGGACLVPTRLEVDESSTSVTVTAFTADANQDGECTMQIVPWFVPLKLTSQLAGRRLIDGSTNTEMRTVDCRTAANEPLCDHPASS